MKVFYSDQYVGADFAFDTTRKAKWIADSLAQSPIDNIELVEPEPLTVKQLLTVHSAEYVEAVKNGEPLELAESQSIKWDSQLWPMVLSSNGGVVAAARAARMDGMSGSLSSGLHHARIDTGVAYCTFNGLAIAALDAVGNGAKTVLILDLDAHHGGGTASLIGKSTRIWQVDVSTNSFDDYQPSVRKRTYTVGSDEYLSQIQAALRDVESLNFDLCLYNAGMDPTEDGISTEQLAKREEFVLDGLPSAKSRWRLCWRVDTRMAKRMGTGRRW